MQGRFDFNKTVLHSFLVMNKEEIMFRWNSETCDGFLNVTIKLKNRTQYAPTILKLLKETVVIVSFIDRNEHTKTNDGVNRNYIRNVPGYRRDGSKILFSEPRFIQIDDMFCKKETGTCYIENGKIDFVVDLYYPHVANIEILTFKN